MRLEVITSCNHWSTDKGCALGLFDGQPTKNDCAECMEYDGPTRGLGDVVHGALDAFGIHALIKKSLSETKAKNEAAARQVKEKKKKEGGCGCGKRRKALNKLLPKKGND